MSKRASNRRWSAARAHIPRRAGLRMVRGLLCIHGGGRSRATLRALDGERTASSRIADLTSAPDDLAWSRDGKSIAFTLFVPDEAVQTRPSSAEARRRDVGAAAGGDYRCNLSRRWGGPVKARLHACVRGRRRWWRAPSADFWRIQRDRAAFLVARWTLHLPERQSAGRLAARAREHRGLRGGGHGRRDQGAYHPQRSGQCSRSSHRMARKSRI